MRSIALLFSFLALQCWGADKPKIVFIAGEYEYFSRETLPAFAADLAKKYEIEPVILKRPDDEKVESIPGLEAVKDADLVVLFVRRMTLPESELEHIRNYVKAGKPLVGLRTASHAFENWTEFDRDVLGGNYGKHYGAALKTTVTPIPELKSDPLLKGVGSFISDGSLYKNNPLRPNTKPSVMGKVNGREPEPVAWTHQQNGGRVFYTSLGHPNDFKQESFRNLVRNGMEWTLGKSLREK